MEEKELLYPLEPFTVLVRKVMDEEGRRNSWLAEKMGVEHQTLLLKYRKHHWTVSEIAFVKNLLNIEYDG